MTGTLADLAWALGLFVGSHFVLSWGPVRRLGVATLGEKPFLGLYSLISIGLFTWIVMAYLAAPDVDVWEPHRAFQHIPLSVMPLACILLFAGYTVPNPSSIFTPEQGGRVPGIIKVTRHPAMWAVAIWGILHVFANTYAAPMMVGGGMAVLALGGAWHMECRRANDPDWQRIKAESAFFPFAGMIGGRVRVSAADVGWWRIIGGVVLYAVLLLAHETLFGASPMPLS